MELYAALLRAVESRLGLLSVRAIALQPGMRAVYRVIVQHNQMRAADTVTTVTQTATGDLTVEVIYAGHFGHRPITRRLLRDDYDAFVNGLTALRFDKLPDQPNIPFYGVDVWLVERAASGFYRSVLVAPQTATGSHAALTALICTHLPEAVREIVP